MNDSVTSIHPQGCAIIASVHFHNYIIPNRNCTHQTVTSLSSPSSDTSLLHSLCMHGAALSTSHGWNFVKCPMSVFIFWRFCGLSLSKAVGASFLLQVARCVCVYTFSVSSICGWTPQSSLPVGFCQCCIGCGVYIVC